MAEFEAYSPEAIIAANLAEGLERHRQICEQERAHLAELATEIASGESLTAEFLASLSEHRLPSPATAVPSLIGSRERADRVWKSVCLCVEILQRLNPISLSPELFFPEADEPTEKANCRILYRKNSYADRAYLQFAALLPSPRASYGETFEAVCEGVHAGECEYCILPLENSEEGRLNSFWRWIDRYGLKLTATCDIPTADHGRTTRFALLRHAPQVLADRHRLGYRIELAIPTDGLPMSDCLLAAEYCDLRVEHIYSDLLSADGMTPVTHLVLRADGDKLPTFLLYLAMEAPDYTLIGYYPHIPH